MAASPAVLLLEAVHFASNAEIDSLRQLVECNQEILTEELVLRLLLTYLPESSDPASYAGFVDDVVTNNLSNLDQADTPLRPEAHLEEEDARQQARNISLLPLAATYNTPSTARDVLLDFVTARAHQIETETGSLLLVQQLVEQFGGRSDALDLWIATSFLPLLRLEYEFYPRDEQIYTLQSFATLRDASGLKELLADLMSRRQPNDPQVLSRDIKAIIAPWLYGEVQRRQRLAEAASDDSKIYQDVHDLWAHLYKWILELSQKDLKAAVDIVQNWKGPDDIDFGGYLESPVKQEGRVSRHYTQTVVAMIYIPRDTFQEFTWDMFATIIERATLLEELEPLPDFRNLGSNPLIDASIHNYLKTISSIHVLPNELIEPGNPLTDSRGESVTLAVATLASTFLISTIGQTLSNESVLSLALFGFEADQRTMMMKILRRLASGSNQSNHFWRETRQKILWLRNWGLEDEDTPGARHGIFCRVPSSEVELELLKALATAGRFNLVNDIYINTSFSKGPRPEQIQKALLDVAYASYDNASNGNKTRGGIKKASDIIATFGPHFPQSRDFSQIYALIQSTHALSFYALTLQHGVPLIPVNIRVHPNPLSLVEKVLSQNQRSYTKLDDLLDIGRNLVKAGLIHKTEDTEDLRPQQEPDLLVAVERKITAQAIAAALKEDDFDTAYSYVVNRLSPNATTTHDGDATNPQSQDTILWQAAYEAGRYTPRNGNGPTELRRLEQRMELLSKALLLAPPSSLQEVLSTWHMCEEEVNTSLAQESIEEEKWNNRGDRHLPGGFTGDDIVPTPHQPRNATRRAMDEEAPMGLFDVARGAASAFSRSAFPLRAQASPRAPGHPAADDTDSNERSSFDGDRVRKRDVVSNMVTGSLASGIGWVIGAPASRQE